MAGGVWRDWSVANLLRNTLSLEGGQMRPADVHRVAEANRELHAHVLPRLVGERRAMGGGSRLHHAAVKDRLGRASALLVAGAPPAARDAASYTPLLRNAVSLEGRGRVGVMLARDTAAYPLPLVEELVGDWRPLFAAASRGHTALVTTLLSRGVDIEGQAEEGTTALAGAASSGKSQCVRLLLAAGAAVDALDADFSTPLMAAAESGHCEAIAQLLAASASCSYANAKDKQAIHVASGAGKVGALRLLLDAGARINAPGEDGRAPLAAAAAGGYVPAVDFLLDRGADVNARDNFGRTAFSQACCGGRLFVARRLHARDADRHIMALLDPPEDDNDEMMSPLEVARLLDEFEVVEWLESLPA